METIRIRPLRINKKERRNGSHEGMICMPTEMIGQRVIIMTPREFQKYTTAFARIEKIKQLIGVYK